MSKNKVLLDSFIEHCRKNPDERFWQALTNWSGLPWVGWAEAPDIKGFHDLWHKED